MLHKLKPVPRALVIVALVGGFAYAALNVPAVSRYFNPPKVVPVATPEKIDLPVAPTAGAGATGTVLNAANASGEIRMKVLAWNGQAGIMYAEASGMYKAKGLNVALTREDSYDKMIADLAASAKDPSQGVHLVSIMGDGYPAFSIGANAALKPFGTTVRAIAGVGYSRGEDKCIIADGTEVRGSLIKGVLGDGDINICVKYAFDNGIPVNADPKTYDPNAMNLTGAKEFTEADQAFIASAKANFQGGACEDRTNVVTNKVQKVCVTGTATWTPGDNNVFTQLKAMGKSIRVLASTKEYSYQMPTLIIGNKAWLDAHRDQVKAFLAATFEAGEKVRSDNAALLKASEMSAKVYGEQDASYWASMFRGTVDQGPNGKAVQLGGSTTNGIADAAFLFGLNGADNLFKKVYTVYGNIAVKLFPDIMPGGLQKYEDVVDSSFVQELLSGATNVAKADTPVFTGATTQTFASKSVSIEFDTGKATFTPKAMAALNAILDDAAVTSLSVQINGHTDNVGDPDSNLALSKARAEAVKKFLMTNAPSNFPAERVVTRGFGDQQPVEANTTAAGKAKNRRVEIILRK